MHFHLVHVVTPAHRLSFQLEERRSQLERYLQLAIQEPRVLHGATFNGFLLGAQQETWTTSETTASNSSDLLDVYLMNEQRVSVRGGHSPASVMQTEEVLERVCRELEVPGDLVRHFGLYLVERREAAGDIVIVRMLQDFESPYISQRSAPKTKIVLRKA